MSDLVSIIIPTYNRAYCVGKTLDSVLAQTHGNFEAIVIDDGSKDHTRDFIREKYGHDARVKYIYQENQGVSGARNTGLLQAQGDYIALLDSDDIWKPWKLETQLRCLQALPHVGMIWSEMEAINPEGELVHPRYLHIIYHAYCWFTTENLFTEKRPLREIAPNLPSEHQQGMLYAGNIFSPMVMGNLVHTSTTVLTRARYDKVRVFDVDLKITGEDYDFHLRTCREGPV